jgi:hypothetical protein
VIRTRLPNLDFTMPLLGRVIIRNRPGLLTGRELEELVVEAFERAANNGMGTE